MSKNYFEIDSICYPEDDYRPSPIENDLGIRNWQDSSLNQSKQHDSRQQDSPSHHCCCKKTFAQVLDPNLSAALSAAGPIQLSTDDASLLEEGGFTLSTNTVTNDTLNFPSTGVYLVDINLRYNFLPPTFIDLGQFYQVVVDIEPVNIANVLPDLARDTGIITTGTISDNITSTFLVNITESCAAIRLNLLNFNFNVSFNQAISFSPIITVTKLNDKPLT